MSILSATQATYCDKLNWDTERRKWLTLCKTDVKEICKDVETNTIALTF